MQGPFSKELNIAQWRQWEIDCVITRESGTEGGLLEKVDAAAELGISVIGIRRPRMSYPLVFRDTVEVVSYIRSL